MDIVDFHAHILPRADHGSASVADSLCQLKLAGKWGVSRIVATPHFYPESDSVRAFIDRRERCYDSLLRESGGSVKIALGAEVLMCQNIESIPFFEKLCIGKSGTVLLELPFNDFDRNYVYSVKEIIRRGFNVVLAHADRYPKENIERLIDCGAKIQLNADSLSTFFKNRTLYRWIDAGLVVAIGSDIHGKNSLAYKNFAKACKKLGERLDFIKTESDKMWDSF